MTSDETHDSWQPSSLDFTEQSKALAEQVDFIFRASSGSDASLGKKSETVIVLLAPYIHPFNTSEFSCKEKTHFILGLSQAIFVVADIAFFFLKHMTYLLEKKSYQPLGQKVHFQRAG